MYVFQVYFARCYHYIITPLLSGAHITYLGMSCCLIRVRACEDQVNNSIESLSLEWNGIGEFDEGIQRLADGLEVNGSLTTLVLCNNHISAQVCMRAYDNDGICRHSSTALHKRQATHLSTNWAVAITADATTKCCTGT